MTTALIDTREELNAKTKALGEIVEAAKTADGWDFTNVKGHGFEGDQKARVEHFQSLMSEVNDLGAKAEEFQKLEAAEQHVKLLEAKVEGKQRSNAQTILPGAGGADEATKSLGELFTDTDAFRDFAQVKAGDSRAVDFDLAKDLGNGSLYTGVKTLMTTSAGWAPEAVRTGRLVDSATRPLQVIDMIPGETTNQSAVVYMEETTYTNAAAETAEGGTFPEAALAFTEKSSPVRKIAVWIPVTDEQLEDVPQLQAYLNNRLGFMVRQRLDAQILVGDGIAPNLEGLTVRSGVLTQALGSDDPLDAIYKARTKVRVTGRAVPNALFIHSTDLQGIALTRTADGIYILGNPDGEGTIGRLWGLRVVENEANTAGTAFVKDTTMTGLAIKRNVTLQVSNSHSTFFVEGKQAVRCDMRVALQDYRPASGCLVTGL